MKIWVLILFFIPLAAFAAGRRSSHSSPLDTLNVFLIFLICAAIFACLFWIHKIFDKICSTTENRRIAAQREYDTKNHTYRDLVFAECERIFGVRPKSIEDISKILSGFKRKVKEEYAQKEIELSNREKVIDTKCMKFPPLARCLAKYDEARLLGVANHLECKRHPARTSAQKVRDAVREASEYILKFYAAKNLVDSYEALFPWIVEYREFDIDEILHEVDEKDIDNSDDPVKFFMSPADYSKLSPVERNQMALERYLRSKKSNWQVGRLYERYIGYRYEQEGYKVSYFGATEGHEDLGRDIIAVKGTQHLIIQCKYWKRDKTIHENVICQLYGTTIRYRFDHSEKDLFGPKYDVHAVLITSAQCSPMARDFAKFLNVELVENKNYEDYPMIKCNINRSSYERIYHLPFDQMYDRVIIETENGEFYAKTCAEAESKGFRRAFRWHGA